MTTLMPETAHACAIPLPMVPAPMMPTVVMRTLKNFRQLKCQC